MISSTHVLVSVGSLIVASVGWLLVNVSDLQGDIKVIIH